MLTRATRLSVVPNRLVYVGIALTVGVIPIIAFWPNYLAPVLRGTAEKAVIVHIHAAVSTGFLVLFITQTVFASIGRVDLHRKVGKLGIGYGLAIVVVGVLTAFDQIAPFVNEGRLLQAQIGLLTPLMDMVVFSIFFLAAVLYRHSPEIHKRLMIVAVTILLDSAASRMEFMPGRVRFIIWCLPILLGITYDLIARRLVHPVYVVGLATIYVMTLRGAFVQSDAWLAISGWLIKVTS